jgi:hypothetical protein
MLLPRKLSPTKAIVTVSWPRMHLAAWYIPRVLERSAEKGRLFPVQLHGCTGCVLCCETLIVTD